MKQEILMLRKFSVAPLAFFVAALGILLTGALLASESQAQSFKQVEDAAAFKDFGEKPGLVRIMDDFMRNLLADPRTKPFFENVDQKRVKEQLVDQFCEILRGPCRYGGAEMKRIHAGMAIDREAFNALVEALQVAMDTQGVPFGAQNKLLAILAPMHRDIVNK
jgi:hemoglobin